MALSADGQLVASGSEDGMVKLWEAASGRLLATLQGHTGAVLGTTQIGLSPRSQVQYGVGALFPAANTPRAGTLTLLAHADGPANLFAYGSIIDNASGDPVFFGGR